MDQLQRVVAAVVDGRRAVEAKERARVASFEEALKRLGYAVVPAPPLPTEADRPRAPRRRGRR